MTLAALNELPGREAVKLFLACCGSKRWVDEMVSRRPFDSVEKMYVMADKVWFSLTDKDWKEAFSAHPKIGDIQSLRKKFRSTAALASREQSGVVGASEKTLKALAEGNAAYEAKFGYIFIVCATGKSADQMFAILNERLSNHPAMELKIAAQEQAKITRMRLERIFNNV